MSKNYYILKSGRLKKKQKTVYLETKKEKIAIPIKDIKSLYIFSEIGINTKLLNFLSKNKIQIHFFNYYGLYMGSFYPGEALNSGKVLIKQVEKYLSKENRIKIAKEIIDSSIFNLLRNLEYYNKQGKDLKKEIEEIKKEKEKIKETKDVYELRGIEGAIRKVYYNSFDKILREGFKFEKRTCRPPGNMLNCLISFGNSLLYSVCLTEIYRTHLNPAISYLHEPSERRFSLSLDIAEIFKPIIVDKIIFNIVNNRIINENHFNKKVNFCYLNESGKRIFLKEFDERLNKTIMHRRLKRKVSYNYLIRLECYKLIDYLLKNKKYNGLKL
ncbi:MAG: type I-B CRISPR-associated endonuclease Cas1b [Candidatus Pacearchaeota archaeon]